MTAKVGPHTKSILNAIYKERESQDEKWGPQDHEYTKWLVILMEEVGEVANAFLEGGYDEMREELVQVAAVCVAIMEDMWEEED